MNETETAATLSPLALDDIDIPGKTVVLPDGSWGINIAAARDNFPYNGLQVRIQPWPTMSINDSVEIQLNGAYADGQRIRQGEVNNRVTLFISPEKLPEGTHTVRYKVTRVNGATELSDTQNLHVKLTRPGGKDQDGDAPGHSELDFTVPPEIVEGGVDKEQAAKGVTVTVQPYPEMSLSDCIRFSWGGEIVEHEVTAAEVDKPIGITFDKTLIERAGDSDSLALTYEAYDVVHNRSEDWAKEVRILVDTGSTRLSAPVLLDAEEDDEGRQFIDLDQITDSLEAMAWIRGSGAVKGDWIELRLRGTTNGGEEVSVVYDRVQVKNANNPVSIMFPDFGVRLLGKSQAIFSYGLFESEDADTEKMVSKSLFVIVVGEPQRLAAPSVREAVGNKLDPELSRVTVMVPWDQTMAAGQIVSLQWLGSRADGGTYLPELPQRPISGGDAEAGEPLPITVPKTHLTPISGGKLELFYYLTSDDRTAPAVTRATPLVGGADDAEDSKTFVGQKISFTRKPGILNAIALTRESLHTGQFFIGEPIDELPAPNVEEADGNKLDPDLPSATVNVDPYRNMGMGDVVHLVWNGSATGVHTDSIRVTQNLVGRQIPFTVRSNPIKGNDGGTVSVSYYVVFADGETKQSGTLQLEVGEQVPLAAPIIEKIREGELGLGDVPDTGVPVIVKPWQGMKAQDKVVLNWTGGASDSVSHTVIPAEVGRDLTLVVPAQTVKDSLDSQVTLQYTVD